MLLEPVKKKIKATWLLQQNALSKWRITINEGSSRSAKTYSLMQMWVGKLFSEENIVITVTRKTLPALKATAYKDFLQILNEQNLYNPSCHNKSDHTYAVTRKIKNIKQNPDDEDTFRTSVSEIEFISVDNFDKVKGRKRDYLHCNEANELNYQDFTQLAIRTTKQIFLDYNPSHEDDHWIEEKVKTRDDVVIIHSTYQDNPFLEREVILEIERLKDTDPNLWKIYGLGIRGIAEARIYTHFELIDEMPENFRDQFYGLDFGFNHPTALVEIRESDDAFYIDEKIYASGLTNSVLIWKMKNWQNMTNEEKENAKKIGLAESDFPDLNINKNKFLFCDHAEPARIEEIKRAGYNAHNSNKDVEKGIDTIKSKKIYITKRSLNILRESKIYSWKTTADGKVLDEPVMLNDDAMCAMRYGIHSYLTNMARQPSIRVF